MSTPTLRQFRFLLILAFFAMLPACGRDAGEERVAGAASDPPRTVTPSDVRVIIMLIDGPRYSETFETPAHVHFMWNTLRPLGTVCTNFRNLGETLTNSGHGSLLTGIWQHIADDALTRPSDPTLFEYYRKATGAPVSDAILLGGKTTLDAVSYSNSPAYGAAYKATSAVFTLSDVATYNQLIQYLDQQSPHLVVCSLSDTDKVAHSRSWNGYLKAIENADSLIALTWNHVQADPDYAGKTYLFVSADHGRHDDAHGDVNEHGDSCDGCQHLLFLALGPGIIANQQIDTAYNQRDLCRTVGQILGVSTPQSEGVVMSDLFVPLPTGVLTTRSQTKP